MKSKSILKALLAVGASIAMVGQISVAYAQQGKSNLENKKEAVLIHLTQKRVVPGAQGEKLEDVTSVKPGDVIEYRATYTNVSGQTVKGLVAKLPVPEGLEYQPKSAKPFNASLQLAARDGQFGAEPLRRKAADGSFQTLAYNEYRTVRWNVGQLDAGASVVVSARAKVEGVLSEPKTIVSTSKALETARP